MLARIIEFSVRQRAFVLAATLALALLGIAAFFRLPIDAVPDITPVQVQVNTPVAALAPEEIESLVTFPLESELAGLPGLIELRSLSKFGLSQITLIFEENTDVYRARQLVQERLQAVSGDLPRDVTPALAPVTTGLGEIFYYVVEYAPGSGLPLVSREAQLMELKLIQDFVIKPRLRATPGVAEVNAIGGYEKQVVVRPDPDRLKSVGMSFGEVASSIAENVDNAGGSVIELGGEQVVVRAAGRVRSIEDIERLPLKFGSRSTPLRVKDVAAVGLGRAVRTGAATFNGEEAVLGAALMLAGENSRVVARRVSDKLEAIQALLPPEVRIIPVYDRTVLVENTLRTVRNNLFEGALLVIAVLLCLLGNWRAACIVACAIPLSLLFAITGMVQTRLSGNLMSLGAIDFGLIIDGAVVMVENILRHLEEQRRRARRRLTPRERAETVIEGGREVVNPMFYGVLIITVVYVPILALTGIEGRMFKPMAITVILALVGSLALALTLMPALCSIFLGREGPASGVPDSKARITPDLDPPPASSSSAGNPPGTDAVFSPPPASPVPAQLHKDAWLMRQARRAYLPVLNLSLRAAWPLAGTALALFALAAFLFTRLGAEFVPQLDEGSFAAHMIRTPSIGLGASIDMQKRGERALIEAFPELRCTFSRIGTSEVATDPMGVNVADTYLMLKPRSEWRQVDGRTISREALVEQMTDVLARHVPGETHLFSQPIEMRFNEILEGTRADITVKVFGSDFNVIEDLATHIREILETVPGAEEVEFDALGRAPMLEIVPQRDAMSRYNIHAAELNQVVSTALAGRTVGRLIEGDRRTDIVVRLDEDLRRRVEELRRLPVRLDDGGLLTLGQVADFKISDQVAAIGREAGQRRAAIMVNLKGRDVEGFVREARRRIAESVQLPPGCTLEFAGQFKNLQQARARLLIVVPAALGLILTLAYLALRSLRQTALVCLGIPLGVTGGVYALWMRDLPFSISAGVGFIALSGVAVLNGLVLISFFNRLREGGLKVTDAARQGALVRLRPVLMTALVASLGFLPMAVSTGAGAEVQRPLATVVIGGILSSTILTLLLIPAFYARIESSNSAKSSRHSHGPAPGLDA